MDDWNNKPDETNLLRGSSQSAKDRDHKRNQTRHRSEANKQLQPDVRMTLKSKQNITGYQQ